MSQTGSQIIITISKLTKDTSALSEGLSSIDQWEHSFLFYFYLIVQGA